MSKKDELIEDLIRNNEDLQSMLNASKEREARMESGLATVLSLHQPKTRPDRDGGATIRCTVCQVPEHHTWAPDNFEPWPCPTIAATGLRWGCHHRSDDILREADNIRAARAEKVMGPVDACPPEEDEVDVNDYEDLPTVCVTHLRFIPCRTDDGCQTSTHPDAVTAVRNFQQNWR